MIDREKVLAVLQKRFPGSTVEERAAAANAIVGLGDEWVDETARGTELACPRVDDGGDLCFLAEQRRQGAEYRILVRRREGG
jgi:hypothetical protein